MGQLGLIQASAQGGHQIAGQLPRGGGKTAEAGGLDGPGHLGIFRRPFADHHTACCRHLPSPGQAVVARTRENGYPQLGGEAQALVEQIVNVGAGTGGIFLLAEMDPALPVQGQAGAGGHDV